MCVLFGVCEKPTQQIFINYPIIVSLFTILLRAASSFKQQQWKQIIITPDWLFNTKQRKNLRYILFSLVGWCSLLLTIFVSDYVYLFHQHRRQPPTINQHRWAVSVLKLTSNAGNARIKYCILCSYILPFTQRHSHSRRKQKKKRKEKGKIPYISRRLLREHEGCLQQQDTCRPNLFSTSTRQINKYCRLLCTPQIRVYTRIIYKTWN